MKQYYETVDVATGELPENETHSTSIWVTCADEHEDVKRCLYNFITDRWECGNDDFKPVSWLRPVSLSDLIREVAGKAWGMALTNQKLPSGYPDKSTYINSLIK